MYHKIITLGYNCEPSLQLRDFFGDIESSVFSWTYIESNKSLIKGIKNIDSLPDCNLRLTDWNMYRNDDLGISWHGDNMSNILYHSKDRTAKDITEFEVNEDKANIKTKLVYLVDKFKNLLDSDERILYIYKMRNDTQEDYEEVVSGLYDSLSVKKDNFDLLIVDVIENKFKDLKRENILNLYLDFYPPDGDVHQADIKNWKKFFNGIRRK